MMPIPAYQSFKVKCYGVPVVIICTNMGNARGAVVIDASKDSLNPFYLRCDFSHPSPPDFFAVRFFEMFWATVYPEGCWEWSLGEDDMKVARAVLRVAEQWTKGRRPKGYIGGPRS